MFFTGKLYIIKCKLLKFLKSLKSYDSIWKYTAIHIHPFFSIAVEILIVCLVVFMFLCVISCENDLWLCH